MFLASMIIGATVRAQDYKPLYEPGMVRAGTNLRAPLDPPPQPADPNFWLVEPDIKLYHFAAGQGPAVLIVHGGPGRPHLKPWPGLAPLTDRYQFLYYDQRGCGQSTRPFDRLDPRNYSRNVQLLDRTLGLGGQYNNWLQRYFDFGSLFSKTESDLVALNDEFGRYYRMVMTGSFPEQAQQGGWMTEAIHFSMGRRHDYTPALKKVAASVLVIHGENDLQPEIASRRYAEAFPHAEFHVIQEAEHFPFHTHPEVFAAVVTDFLDKNRSPSP